MTNQDFLLEIGCEEIPAKDQQMLARALLDGLTKTLDTAQVSYGDTACYAGPRRLAVLLRHVAAQQDSREVLKRGPAVERAVNADGTPSPAAEGFARSCGVTVDMLERQCLDKGEFLVYRQREAGQPTDQLFQNTLPQLIQRLPLRKRMRWGDSHASFVRPVRWVLARFGDTPLPLTLFEQKAGNQSHGHRIHHPGPVAIPAPADYVAALQGASVLVDFGHRRGRIREEVARLAAEMQGIATMPDGLLDEVSGLVEWPVVLAGGFEARYLDIPPEVLSTVMMQHQRYFPVYRQNQPDALLNRFIFVANLESSDPQSVIHGNSRVLRARLADAAFFWNEDRKLALDARRAALANVLFQQGLGSLLDKSLRLAELAPEFAAALRTDEQAVRRAAELCKCDLLSGMVGEFPELQGVMGAYYARHDGETDAVTAAIRDHYAPAGRADAIPADAGARALALTDKLDTLAGFFAIGQIPSGDKDPFGLRRAALGALRILLEADISLDLPVFLQRVLRIQHDQLGMEADCRDSVFDFLLDRLRVFFREEGFAADLVESVISLRPGDPLDARKRLEAMARFRARPEAAALAAANKRIGNILRKEGIHDTGAVNPAALAVPAEEALWNRWQDIAPRYADLVDRSDYSPALDLLAGLRDAVDRFFDEVMVMAEERDIRANRLALIGTLRHAFLRIADFSLLQG